MTVSEALQEVNRRGIILQANGDRLRVNAPRGMLTPDMKDALAAYKPELLQLLTAPEADLRSETPCAICGSHERWIWLDGRHICRVCLILDLAPLTMVRQGWPGGTQRGGPPCT